MRATGALILEAAGAGPEEARAVADSLVGSDVRGVHSHGVVRIPDYVRAMKEGRITAGARTVVTADVGAVVALDGQRGFGQVAARTLAETAAGRARLHGISLALLTNVSHVGRLGEWVEQVADEGLVALAWCNCGDPGGNVVPFGGRESRLGTNPMAYAVPAAGRRPVVADFSTSIVAEGKVRVFLHEGRELPPGWIWTPRGIRPPTPLSSIAAGRSSRWEGTRGLRSRSSSRSWAESSRVQAAPR